MISGEFRAAARRLNSAQTDGQMDRRGSRVPLVSDACCAWRPWPALRGVPKCRHGLYVNTRTLYRAP